MLVRIVVPNRAYMDSSSCQCDGSRSGVSQFPPCHFYLRGYVGACRRIPPCLISLARILCVSFHALHQQQPTYILHT